MYSLLGMLSYLTSFYECHFHVFLRHMHSDLVKKLIRALYNQHEITRGQRQNKLINMIF